MVRIAESGRATPRNVASEPGAGARRQTRYAVSLTFRIGHYAYGPWSKNAHLHEPFAELVRLSRDSIADDKSEDGIRGVPGE
jgi:hypothetical protein